MLKEAGGHKDNYTLKKKKNMWMIFQVNRLLIKANRIENNGMTSLKY